MRWIWVIGWCLSGYWLHGQIITSVISSEDTVKTGEAFDVVVQVKYDQGIKPLDYAPYDDIENLAYTQDTLRLTPMGDIEWHSDKTTDGNTQFTPPANAVISDGGFMTFADTIQMTIWDYGLFRLPHPVVMDSLSAKMPLESPVVMVLPPIVTNPDTTQLILPNDPIIREHKTFMDRIRPYLGAILIMAFLGVLGAILLYLRSKRKKVEISTQVSKPKPPAHITALDKLNALERQNLIKEGKIKEFQSSLTFILREYLEDRYDFHALEQTTAQISRELTKQDLTLEQRKTLSQLLQIADMVKFAKAQPPETIHADYLHKAKAFVEETKLVTPPKSEEDA